MIIKKINLNNFRNYSHLSLDLNSKMNIFIGENAQGKTNILESICFLALTKTYRQGVEPNLISFGKEISKVSAKVKKKMITNTLEIVVRENSNIIRVNDNNIRKISDYISNLNVIMFTPDDLEIIKGSPSIRRNLMNIELSQISKKYLNTYNEYNKILKMRNEYLKLLLKSSSSDKKYLDIITEKLVEKAIIIYQERKRFFDLINQRINNIYINIVGEEILSVKYEPNIIIESYMNDCLREKLISLFAKNYERELNCGITLYGPHRDDFSFYLNGKNLKLFGSQGQQKISVLSFKLSEIDIFEKYNKDKPVLLLDDIFSELDIKKRNKLLNYINNDIQSIITTTDLKNIRKSNIDDAYIFEINNGKVERRK